jgi:Spy/CpxP family protein refolding chaperone
MKYRVYPCVALLTLALPTLVARATEGHDARETSGTQEIVTVDSMRSVVLSLVAQGWDDFLLKSRNELGLSTSQDQKLLSLRLGFSEATEEVEKRLEEAKLALYEELDRDRVATREVEAQVRWLSALRGELVVLRFRYLLRAINVLNPEQHQKLAALLQLQRLLPGPPVWDEPSIEPQTAYPEALPYAALQLGQYSIRMKNGGEQKLVGAVPRLV